ncbi:MAG: hypothetical protein HOK97_18650 [Deltaproteobacteria bacterium]|jgi:hypothetical protein|nr:hypothetical protein [Deltaproteobacteria bacterium]MBT6491795.1 hypothetical protein [Deltaproteobacteria bacterium]
MPAITNNQPITHNYLSNTASAPSRAPASPQAQLEALNQQYPNLDQSLEQARADVASSKGADTWAGLKWYEKAVFFVPPFGPLIGVMMLDSNKDMIRSADNKLEKLENVATQRDALKSQIAANQIDRWVA